MHNYNLGRFTSPDEPLIDQWKHEPQSWSLYISVRNNPLRLVDPSGTLAEGNCLERKECKLDDEGKEYYEGEDGNPVYVDEPPIIVYLEHLNILFPFFVDKEEITKMIVLQNSTFLEAKTYFQDFLAQQGVSKDLIWVFREDIIPQADGILIKTPLPSRNEELVKRCYEMGYERKLGVCFIAFALLDSHPCCYVQLPSDDTEAEYMLMSDGLKCSMNTDLLEAKSVNSGLTWAISKFTRRIFENIGYPANMPDKNHCF